MYKGEEISIDNIVVTLRYCIQAFLWEELSQGQEAEQQLHLQLFVLEAEI